MVLDRLYVDPRWWRQGIGSALHDGALAVAADRGARSINLWVLEENLPARAMYERRGWRRLPGWTRPNVPPTVVDVLYEQTLAPPFHGHAVALRSAGPE
jgi:predicted N-acetyltransferase YhbS